MTDKITIDRSVLQQALDWFNWLHAGNSIESPMSSTQVKNALRGALTAPQPLFTGLIAQHPGLADELLEAFKCRAIFLESLHTQPVRPADPVSGVVIREGLPTLLQDKHIKGGDLRLYLAPQPPRQPLADWQIRDCIVKVELQMTSPPKEDFRFLLSRAVEQAHGITKGEA